MNIQINDEKRAEVLDDLWNEGMLLDTTYLRTLVFDGLDVQAATSRLNRLKAAKGQPVLPVGLQPKTKR